MKQVKLHFTVSGSYTVPLDESAIDAYGTLDPKEIARLDQELLKEDIASFWHQADTFIVVPGKVTDKEER